MSNQTLYFPQPRWCCRASLKNIVCSSFVFLITTHSHKKPRGTQKRKVRETVSRFFRVFPNHRHKLIAKHEAKQRPREPSWNPFRHWLRFIPGHIFCQTPRYRMAGHRFSAGLRILVVSKVVVMVWFTASGNNNRNYPCCLVKKPINHPDCIVLPGTAKPSPCSCQAPLKENTAIVC